MKKYLALLLALVMVFALAACGGTAETPAPATEAPAAEPETPAETDPMADLIAAAQAEGELTVYGSCEEEYLAAACEHFQ